MEVIVNTAMMCSQVTARTQRFVSRTHTQVSPTRAA